MEKAKRRCAWVRPGNTLYEIYHDTEWGVPVHDDRILFEFLILESAQAGLSWETILKKRAAYAKAFEDFDPNKVAAFTKQDVRRLLRDTGIVRNRLKIESAIKNAQLFLEIQKRYGSFSKYVWSFVRHRPLDNRRQTLENIPAVTKEAETLSQALKKQGFKFFGPTITYAFMQAVGLVNDHTRDCFRYQGIKDHSRAS